jgi:hypothetical protein
MVRRAHPTSCSVAILLPTFNKKSKNADLSIEVEAWRVSLRPGLDFPDHHA